MDRQLIEGEDAPELFRPNEEHSTAVDMWNLGRPIRTSQVSWDGEPERTSFTNWLLEVDPSDRPSAREALKRLWELKSNDWQALEKLERKEQQEIVAFNEKRKKELMVLEEKRVKKIQQLEHEELRRKRRKVQKRQNQKMKKKMKQADVGQTCDAAAC